MAVRFANADTAASGAVYRAQKKIKKTAINSRLMKFEDLLAAKLRHMMSVVSKLLISHTASRKSGR